MEVLKQQVSTRSSVQDLIRADFEREKAKREQADEIGRIVRLMVPKFILNMEKQPPTITHGSASGEAARLPESFYLGYGEGHGIWRQFLTGEPPPAEEWSVTLDTKNKKFVVVQGSVMWSNVCVNLADPMDALADQDVSYASVSDGDERYLYIEITLSTSPSTSNATVILGDTGYYPIDDPAKNIVRWPLSGWSFAVDGTEIVPTQLKPIAWSGGHIHIVPASVGPP